MIRFDLDTWKKRPDLYPMVQFGITPLAKPTLGHHLVEHGDILVPRADGSWHAMSEDVFIKVRREFYE